MALGLHIHQDESHIIEFTDSEASASVKSDSEDDDAAFPTAAEKPASRRRSSTFIELPAVPSTVAEEDEMTAKTNADEPENVCTSCGAQPEPSFVALVRPCPFPYVRITLTSPEPRPRASELPFLVSGRENTENADKRAFAVTSFATRA